MTIKEECSASLQALEFSDSNLVAALLLHLFLKQNG